MSKNSVTITEAKKLIEYTIDNNKLMEATGIVPLAVNLVGESGIGKTSLVRQIAAEKNMGFVKLNLAQLDEVGDLVGFPVKEYEAQIYKLDKQEDGTVKRTPLRTVWGLEDTFKGLNPKSYSMTGKVRMGYAKPSWVPEAKAEGNIVLLDDYTRCTPVFAQAIMDLMLEQKYVSWTLPKGTTIVLTSNPDNGNYNVTGLDAAQRGRCVNYEIEFDIDAWSMWAEKNNIDSRCINFAITYYNELFSHDEQGNSIADPRSFAMFANMIANIKDWENLDNLAFIKTIANGCFHDDQARFGSMFASFIKNKMHLLMPPKKMLLEKWDTIEHELYRQLYDNDGELMPAVSSLMERRFASYVCAWLDNNDKTPISVVKDRVLDFIQAPKKMFTEDQYYHMITTITSVHKAQTNKLLYEPAIAKKIQ